MQRSRWAATLSVGLFLAAQCATVGAASCEVEVAANASAPEPAPRICKKGGSGTLLPLFASEYSWGGVRVVLYLFGLLWCFLGVGIIADIFMGAIEVITSKEYFVDGPGGEQIAVKRWNATVANLTLMALGSSAPEILLSVIEIMGNSYFSGDLGPSTIVGSAAFNLLVIIAVCVTALPAGESRKIQDMNVHTITATSSVFAYVWLLIILMFVTPNVVDPAEGLLTFLFFPILVFVAYAADNNFWRKDDKIAPQGHIISIGGKKFGHGEVAAILAELKIHKDLTTEEKQEIVTQLAMASASKMSRAQMRCNAIRTMTGQKRVVPPPPDPQIMAKYKQRQAEAAAKGEELPPPKIYFGDSGGNLATQYAVLESEPAVVLSVCRDRPIGVCTVGYYTEDGSAKGGGPEGKCADGSGADYEATEGTLTFNDGEVMKQISVRIFDDDEVEADEKFFVKLRAAEPFHETQIGGVDGAVAEVTVIDDDEPGEIGFPEGLVVQANESSGHAMVEVQRKNGSAGSITCSYRTIDGTAVGGKDYTAVAGELKFAATETRKTIRIPINDNNSYERNEDFKVELHDIKGPVSSGEHKVVGEFLTATVRIMNDDEAKAMIDDVTKLVAINVDKYKMGTSNWASQFSDALQVQGEDDTPTSSDYAMHFITLPWKLFFALVPPTDYGGGTVCFCIALVFIGFVTALIGDLASLFGCVMGLEDACTAITFVALGTSLPDTFASKSATIADDTADAAIGNVTGSNSVNVFLGLGLPWSIAALYWAAQDDCTDAGKAWIERYGTKDGSASGWDSNSGMDTHYKDFGKMGFVVPSGSLGVSVSVFTLCALICLGSLTYRRSAYGAELGGPVGPAKAFAALYVFLWFVYIMVSSLVIYGII